jgi:hypothetical protein
LDQQRQINDAHCLDSFDAADELAVGCAPLDGGDFDAETDLIEGDTVALPAMRDIVIGLSASPALIPARASSFSETSRAEAPQKGEREPNASWVAHKHALRSRDGGNKCQS